MGKPQIEYILLACCTCMRPQMFLNCLESILSLNLPQNIKVELLVVDNDLNKTGYGVLADFSAKTALTCRYFVEENRGLAFARNRLLEEAINLGASHIMMFDDDEILTPDALLEHIKLCGRYDEPIISSGVVINKFEDDTPNYIKKSIVFKQKTFKKTGTIKNYCASGNVFFPVKIIKDNNLRFSEKYVFMGGEDGEFFSRASGFGCKVVQNSESVLYEVIGCETTNIKDLLCKRKQHSGRASMNYIIRKSYYNGFAGSFSKFMTNRKKISRIFYIAKQIITIVLNLLLLLPTLFFDVAAGVNSLSRAIRAWGKIRGAISEKPLDFYREIYGE